MLLLGVVDGRNDFGPSVVQAPRKKCPWDPKGALPTVVVDPRALVQLVKGANGGLPTDAPIVEGDVPHIPTGAIVQGPAARRTQAPFDGPLDVVEAVLAAAPHTVFLIDAVDEWIDRRAWILRRALEARYLPSTGVAQHHSVVGAALAVRRSRLFVSK